MKNKYSTIVSMIVLLLALVVSAEAKGMGDTKGAGMDSDACQKIGAGGGKMMGEMMCGDITNISELNLTDTQKEHARELRKSHEKDACSLQDKLIAQRRELKKLWLEKIPDEDKIFALRKEMNETKTNCHKRLWIINWQQ